MDKELARAIRNIRTWDELNSFRGEVSTRGAIGTDVQAALEEKSMDLGRAFIGERTKLNLRNLSPAQEQIVRAVSEYVGLMRQQRKYPQRTIEQLRNRGLLGAAETAVAKRKPTQGYKALADAHRADLSFEQIVVDHPEEFTPRALWFSRRTLGLPNDTAMPPKQVGGRNPRWSRDELILTLDLYLRHRSLPPSKNAPEVLELSVFLNKMGKALGVESEDTYRNANGVYMNMMNFRRLDPESRTDGKIGLTHGNKDGALIWEDFSGDRDRLSRVVAAIKATIARAPRGLASSDDVDIIEAQEGRVLTRLHRSRERSRELVESRKNKALKEHGRLLCEACGLDFKDKYGTDVAGVIDCHHTKPVHTLAEGAITKLEDLALLCPNCHRVVHSFRPWLSLGQLKKLLGK